MDKIAGLNIGADDYVTKPFNPMELIPRVNSNLRRYVNFSMENENEISASGLLFKIQLPDSKQKIICNLDGKRTYRIFDNLISNILKYSLPSSRVYIDVSLNMNKVLIVFKNISAYEMNFNPNDIAERFVRGDKSRNTDGSGLGLSIAKSFTELQGG